MPSGANEPPWLCTSGSSTPQPATRARPSGRDVSRRPSRPPRWEVDAFDMGVSPSAWGRNRLRAYPNQGQLVRLSPQNPYLHPDETPPSSALAQTSAMGAGDGNEQLAEPGGQSGDFQGWAWLVM